MTKIFISLSAIALLLILGVMAATGDYHNPIWYALGAIPATNIGLLVLGKKARKAEENRVVWVRRYRR